MKHLAAIYKYSFPKKQDLPEVHYICKRDDEDYFFYQLEGSNYISLEILLKSYLSQIIRLSIGQCLILIQLIYEKVIEVYKKEGKTLPKITLQNTWIYTDTGFSGEITPQNLIKIIFLNYQDENVSIEENLKQLQLINHQIKKYCLKTEFKIRAIDGKNNQLIQQTINSINEMFYNIEMCLFQNPKEIKNVINQYVVDNTQETDFEYHQEDVQYIQRNFQNAITKFNDIFKQDCQNELQLHRKLLNWQQQLFDYFIETTWDQSGHESIMRILTVFEQKIKNNEFMTSEIAHIFFTKLEKQGFLNFNSKIIRFSSEIRLQRELEQLLENEKNNRTSKLKKNNDISDIYQQRVNMDKEKSTDIKKFNEGKPLRDYNLKILQEYYKNHSQNTYKLYDRFYYTVNFQNKWTDFIKNEIIPEEKNRIKLDDDQLEKTISVFFEGLLKENKIGINNAEIKPKYI